MITRKDHPQITQITQISLKYVVRDAASVVDRRPGRLAA